MKFLTWKRPLLMLGICLLLLVPPGAFAETPDMEARTAAQGLSLKLPFINLGLEIITEGTSNYPVQRTLTNFAPLDQDLTVFFLWGYTGDKFIVKITDSGDTGDRIMGIMYSSTDEIAWGTMYSSSSQKYFEMDIPIFEPGVLVFLYSAFISPSSGANAYTYTIEVSYPQ